MTFLDLYNIIVSVKEVSVAIILMVLIDTILGIRKAKNNGDFTSNALRNGLIDKSCKYFAFGMLGIVLCWMFPFISKDFIIGDYTITLNIANIIAMIMICIELTSIDENIKEIPLLYNFLKSIINIFNKQLDTDQDQDQDQE